MSSIDEIKEQMELQTEDPRRNRKKVEVPLNKSKFNPKELKKKVGNLVWVKCVSELKPWAGTKPMRFWEDYEIPVEEAILLDERRFVVILTKGD